MQICFGFFAMLVTMSVAGPAPLIPAGFESLDKNTSLIQGDASTSNVRLHLDTAAPVADLIEEDLKILHGDLKNEGYEVQQVSRVGQSPTTVLLVRSEEGSKAAFDKGIIDQDEYARQVAPETNKRGIMLIDLDLLPLKSMEEIREYANSSGRVELVELHEAKDSDLTWCWWHCEYNAVDTDVSRKLQKNFAIKPGFVSVGLNFDVEIDTTFHVVYDISFIPLQINVHTVGCRADYDINGYATVTIEQKFTKTFADKSKKIIEPVLVNQLFFLYALPIHIKATLPLTIGTGDIVLTAEAKMTYKQPMRVWGVYHTTCDVDKMNCESDDSAFVEKNVPKGQITSYSVKGTVAFDPYVILAVKGVLYRGALWAVIGVKASVPASVTALVSNGGNCFNRPYVGLDIDLKVDLVLKCGSEWADYLTGKENEKSWEKNLYQRKLYNNNWCLKAPHEYLVEVADKTAVKDCQMYGNCEAWGAANCLTDEVVINPGSTDCSQETCCKSPDEFKQLLHKSCSKSKLSKTKYRSARSAQAACKLEGHNCRGYYVSGCDFSETPTYYKLCNPKAYTDSSSSCVFDKIDKEGCYFESDDGTDLKPGEWVPGCSHCTFDTCQDKARELSATYLAYTNEVYAGYCKVQMQNVTSPDLTTHQGYGYKLFKFNENLQC